MGPFKTAAAVAGIYALMIGMTWRRAKVIVREVIREVAEEEASKRPRPIDF